MPKEVKCHDKAIFHNCGYTHVNWTISPRQMILKDYLKTLLVIFMDKLMLKISTNKILKI